MKMTDSNRKLFSILTAVLGVIIFGGGGYALNGAIDAESEEPDRSLVDEGILHDTETGERKLVINGEEQELKKEKIEITYAELTDFLNSFHKLSKLRNSAINELLVLNYEGLESAESVLLKASQPVPGYQQFLQERQALRPDSEDYEGRVKTLGEKYAQVIGAVQQKQKTNMELLKRKVELDVYKIPKDWVTGEIGEGFSLKDYLFLKTLLK